MKLIGLSGPAGVGKDSIADYLVEVHNFSKFSFSDALYKEVSEAYDIPVADLMDRETKERPWGSLCREECSDVGFRVVLLNEGFMSTTPISPRRVLQLWGTAYRRAQDPEYWIKQAALYAHAWLQIQKEDIDAGLDPKTGLVNCSVRFPNESLFITQNSGEVWHVVRPGWRDGTEQAAASYVSEAGLTPAPADKVIYNNGTIEQLRTATSLLLGAQPGSVMKAGPELFDARMERGE